MTFWVWKGNLKQLLRCNAIKGSDKAEFSSERETRKLIAFTKKRLTPTQKLSSSFIPPTWRLQSTNLQNAKKLSDLPKLSFVEESCPAYNVKVELLS